MNPGSCVGPEGPSGCREAPPPQWDVMPAMAGSPASRASAGFISVLWLRPGPGFYLFRPVCLWGQVRLQIGALAISWPKPSTSSTSSCSTSEETTNSIHVWLGFARRGRARPREPRWLFLHVLRTPPPLSSLRSHCLSQNAFSSPLHVRGRHCTLWNMEFGVSSPRCGFPRVAPWFSCPCRRWWVTWPASCARVCCNRISAHEVFAVQEEGGDASGGACRHLLPTLCGDSELRPAAVLCSCCPSPDIPFPSPTPAASSPGLASERPWAPLLIPAVRHPERMEPLSTVCNSVSLCLCRQHPTVLLSLRPQFPMSSQQQNLVPFRHRPWPADPATPLPLEPKETTGHPVPTCVFLPDSYPTVRL